MRVIALPLALDWLDGDRSAETLAFAATLELEGKPLELRPTDAIDDVELDERAGEADVLVARSSRGDPDDDGYRRGAYELEVVDEPSDGETRSQIIEQVLRCDRLRDAIAIARGRDVPVVRIEEYDASIPIFGHDTDGIYEYQGTWYRIRTRELQAN